MSDNERGRVASRVAANLAALLDQRKITQAQLARKIHRDQSTISNILSGKRDTPLRTLDLIAEALNVAPEYFTADLSCHAAGTDSGFPGGRGDLRQLSTEAQDTSSSAHRRVDTGETTHGTESGSAALLEFDARLARIDALEQSCRTLAEQLGVHVDHLASLAEIFNENIASFSAADHSARRAAARAFQSGKSATDRKSHKQAGRKTGSR